MDSLDLHVRFQAPDDNGVFTGHAAVWNETNSYRETVQRGAFKRSLTEHRVNGTKPLMLWAHDPREIVGVWTDIREDETGLAVTGRIVTATTRGRETYELLKAEALNGLSIGFRSRGDKRGANGVRVLTEVDLAEISIVGMPSASRARIKSIRSIGRSNESAAAFVKACRKASRSLRQGTTR